MTETSTLDRFAIRLEATVSHYASNRQLLYKLLVSGALITYCVSIAWTLTTSLRAYDVFLAAPNVAVWLVLSLVTCFALIAVALGLKSRITRKQPTGLTLAAVFLVGNLVTFHIFIFLFGLYAFLNEPFRADARIWGPKWYQDLCTHLD